MANTYADRFLGGLYSIVAPWKFDVLRTSILSLEASWANICFKKIQFPWGYYQPIVPRQKHSDYCLNRQLSECGLIFWLNFPYQNLQEFNLDDIFRFNRLVSEFCLNCETAHPRFLDSACGGG